MRILIRDRQEARLIKLAGEAGMSPSAYIAKLIENTQTGGNNKHGTPKE
ncbi:hypothetical protein AB4342_01295 [Vibrio breoganii]